ADRPRRRRPAPLPCHRTRGPGHHHIARDGPLDRRPRHGPRLRNSSRTVPSGAPMKVTVNGQPVDIPEGAMVSAAVVIARLTAFRRLVTIGRASEIPAEPYLPGRQ